MKIIQPLLSWTCEKTHEKITLLEPKGNIKLFVILFVLLGPAFTFLIAWKFGGDVFPRNHFFYLFLSGMIWVVFGMILYSSLARQRFVIFDLPSMTVEFFDWKTSQLKISKNEIQKFQVLQKEQPPFPRYPFSFVPSIKRPDLYVISIKLKNQQEILLVGSPHKTDIDETFDLIQNNF